MRDGWFINTKGFSLVDAMMGIGVGVTVIMATTSVLLSYDKGLTVTNAVATRDNLVDEVKSVGSNYNYLQNLAAGPGNGLLKKCLTGGGCTSVGGAQPLTLYAASAASANLALSGPPGACKFYDISGQPCVGAKTCPFQLTTSFLAQCAANPPMIMVPPSSCPGPPDGVQIIYTIQQVNPLGTDNITLPTFTGTILVQGPN